MGAPYLALHSEATFLKHGCVRTLQPQENIGPLLIGSSETGTTCKLRRRRRVDALIDFATMGCRISGKICCSCICYNASDPESSLL